MSTCHIFKSILANLLKERNFVFDGAIVRRRKNNTENKVYLKYVLIAL